MTDSNNDQDNLLIESVDKHNSTLDSVERGRATSAMNVRIMVEDNDPLEGRQIYSGGSRENTKKYFASTMVSGQGQIEQMNNMAPSQQNLLTNIRD